MNQLQNASEILEFATEQTDFLAWVVYYAKSRTALLLLVMSILLTIATATIFLAGLILYAFYVAIWASLSFNLQYLKWTVRIDGPNVSFEGVRPLGRSKRSFQLSDIRSLIVHDGGLEIKLANHTRPDLVLIGCGDCEVQICHDLLAANATRNVAAS